MFTEDVLVEFARLAREYPAEPAENLWEQAGGTTTRAVDAPCAECAVNNQSPQGQHAASASRWLAERKINMPTLSFEIDNKVDAETLLSVYSILNYEFDFQEDMIDTITYIMDCMQDNQGCSDNMKEAIKKASDILEAANKVG